MNWTTACPDWEARIVNRQSLIPCPPLFPDEAEEALKVFKSLPVVDLPGMPTFGEVARPWVLDFVAAIFGAYNPDTGVRLINNFFELISKKNGKSTIAAGIMITALVRNWRNNNELTILAPTIEIAKNAADPAMAMVQRKPELAEMLRAVPHRRLIEHRTTKAELKILAADTETVGGSKAGFVLIDEEWLFGKMVRAEDMFREATGGLASRPEGFVIKLTTMSDEPPAGVFKSDLERFRDIRDGKIEDRSSLGVLYEYPKQMLAEKDYLRREFWYITNPNLGASVREEFLAQKMDEARNNGAQSLAGFLAKHLNVEIGQSLRSDRWAGADFWEGAADKTITLDSLLDRSEFVTVGIDGGGLDDLLGLCVLGRDRETRKLLCWCHAWAHTSVLERRKDIASHLRDFEKDEDLTVVSNMTDAFAEVADIVERTETLAVLAGRWDKKPGVGVDAIGIGEIIDELGTRNISGDRIAAVPQGFKLQGSIKSVEVELADGKFQHSGSRLMAWCVGNAKVEQRGNAILITKQAAGWAKIDPLVAVFDARAVMPAEQAPSVYEERGLRIW